MSCIAAVATLIVQSFREHREEDLFVSQVAARALAAEEAEAAAIAAREEQIEEFEEEEAIAQADASPEE